MEEIDRIYTLQETYLLSRLMRSYKKFVKAKEEWKQAQKDTENRLTLIQKERREAFEEFIRDKDRDLEKGL